MMISVSLSPDGRLTILHLIATLVSYVRAAGTAYALYYDYRSNSSQAVSPYYGMVPGYNSTMWFQPSPAEYRLDAHFPLGPVSMTVDSSYFNMINEIPVTQVTPTRMAKFRGAHCGVIISLFDIKPYDIKWVNTHRVKAPIRFDENSRPRLDFISEITGVVIKRISSGMHFYYHVGCAILFQYNNYAPSFLLFDDFSVTAAGSLIYWLRADLSLNKPIKALNASGLLLPYNFCGYICRGIVNVPPSEDFEVYPQILDTQQPSIGTCYWNPYNKVDCSSKILGFVPNLAEALDSGRTMAQIADIDTVEIRIIRNGLTYTYRNLLEAEASLEKMRLQDLVKTNMETIYGTLMKSISKIFGSGFRDAVVAIIDVEKINGTFEDWSKMHRPATFHMIYIGVVGFALTLLIFPFFCAVACCMIDDKKKPIHPAVREQMGNINVDY